MSRHEVPLLTGEWPPPSVVGASPFPYPGSDGRHHQFFLSSGIKRVQELRRAALGRVAVGQVPLGISLAHLTNPVIQRDHEFRWNVSATGLLAIACAAGAAGLTTKLHAPAQLILAGSLLHRQLTTYLERYLSAIEWWTPETMPKLTGALVRFFSIFFEDRERPLDWDDRFPGEQAAAAREPVRREENESPWDHRLSRLTVEMSIEACGRIAPYRLRPLVLFTTNAARRRWAYGGWGVYDADAAGRPGALLAIEGKHPRYQHNTWFAPTDFTGAAPSPDVVDWRGPYFDDGYDSPHEVRCAMTEAVLFEDGTPTAAASQRPAHAFLPSVPAVLSGLSDEYDRVIFAPQ